jgi:hypothetical protein
MSKISMEFNFFRDLVSLLEEIERQSESSSKHFNVFIENFGRMGAKLQEYERAVDSLYEIGNIYVPLETEPVNPYDTILDWVRVEILDIKAIMECIQRKDDISSQRQKLEKQLASSNVKLEKI